jgi:hypothetical protein
MTFLGAAPEPLSIGRRLEAAPAPTTEGAALALALEAAEERRRSGRTFSGRTKTP